MIAIRFDSIRFDSFDWLMIDDSFIHSLTVLLYYSNLVSLNHGKQNDLQIDSTPSTHLILFILAHSDFWFIHSFWFIHERFDWSEEDCRFSEMNESLFFIICFTV
jgi:hypothetical protein